MAKVFISFDYDDIEAKNILDNWENQNIGLDISLSSLDGQNYLERGENYVKKIIREKINASQVLLVLVGQNTHNRPWIMYEVHHAKCQGLKIIWTQITETNGAPPKEISKLIPIPFDINSIREAIRK